jgi:NitT/TauT family transport system permease protein
MRVRQPISLRWRVGLGVASVLLLLLAYTILAQARQRTVRREQREVAGKRLAELAEQRSRLADERRDAAELEDAERRERQLERIASDEADLDREQKRWRTLADQPDAVDLTVPSWGMLWREGLVRPCTPQGAFKRKEIWIVSDFKVTALRLLTGLAVGAISAILLGLLMGCVDAAEAFLMPPFAFLSKVPATAVLPIFFVLVQINFKMYVVILAFGMLPTLAQAISQSVRKDVPDELIDKAYTLGASHLELIWEVVFKQILPRILGSARLQIGPALVLLVAAEWMVAGEGIGYRLRLFYQRTDMTVVFVYVAILGLVGLAADYALIWTRRKLCPWFGD